MRYFHSKINFSAFRSNNSKKILKTIVCVLACANISQAQPIAAVAVDPYSAPGTQYRIKWQDNRVVSGISFGEYTESATDPYHYSAMGKTIVRDADGYIISINPGIKSSGKKMLVLNKFNPTGNSNLSASSVFQNEYVHSTLSIQSAVVKVDAYNNIYVAGGSDIGKGFLTKFDPNGNIVWEKVYDSEEFYDIAIYNGYGSSTAVNIYGIISSSGTTGGGPRQIVKYNAAGTKLWNVSYWGSTASIYSIAIDETSSSSVLTTDRHRVYITGGYGTDHSSSIAMLAAITPSNGNVIWEDKFTGGSLTIASNRNYGKKVMTDGAGRIYVLADVYTDGGYNDAGVLRYSISPAIGTDGEAKPSWFVKHDSDNGDRYDVSVVDMEIRSDGSELFLLVNIKDYTYSGDIISNYNTRLIKCSSTGSRVWTSSPQVTTKAKYGVDLELLPDGRIVYLSKLVTREPDKYSHPFESSSLTVVYNITGNTSSESAAPYTASGNTQTIGMALCVDGDNDIYVNGYSLNNPVKSNGTAPIVSSAATNIAFKKTTVPTDGIIDPPMPRGTNVDNISSLENISSELYPNPSNGSATLYFGSTAEKQVKVYSFDGKLIKEFNATDSSIQLDLENVAKGIYSIQVIMESERTLHKMIID